METRGMVYLLLKYSGRVGTGSFRGLAVSYRRAAGAAIILILTEVGKRPCAYAHKVRQGKQIKKAGETGTI